MAVAGIEHPGETLEEDPRVTMPACQICLQSAQSNEENIAAAQRFPCRSTAGCCVSRAVCWCFSSSPRVGLGRHCIHGDWDAVAVGQTPSQGLQGASYAVWNPFIFPHFLEEVCGEQ